MFWFSFVGIVVAHLESLKSGVAASEMSRKWMLPYVWQRAPGSESGAGYLRSQFSGLILPR